jgi:leader peptidase (prepilin peptidase)/N-methyltransferase
MAASSLRARIAAHGLTAAVMVGAAGISLYLLPLPVSAFAALLAIVAVFIAAVDLEYFVIPDVANLTLIAFGFVLTVMEAVPGETLAAVGDAFARCAVAGAALLALRYAYLRRAGVEGLGLGDAKLAAAGAAWLAWASLPIALLIASVGGILAIATRSLNQRKMPDRKAEIPFGAFLAPAIWLAFLLERSGALIF